MIRVVIENILLFLLPTLVYVVYTLVARQRGAAGQGQGQGGEAAATTGVLDDAPLLWLFATGTILVVVTLILFGSTSGGKPGETYVPPQMKDGRIEPGHSG